MIKFNTLKFRKTVIFGLVDLCFLLKFDLDKNQEDFRVEFCVFREMSVSDAWK